MSKLRVGVIGCGRISVMHFGSIINIDGLELVACCDIKPERAEKVAKDLNINAYTDYVEMFEKENLDAVHICLPHYIHTDVAKVAFGYGIHVLSEKPMDVSYEKAESAVNMAKEKGVLYGIIFQCRYNNSARLVKNAVASGKLGKVLSASSTLTWSRSDEYYSNSDWKGTWDKEGGGVIIDQAIHSIDLTNWIIDSPVKAVSVSMANRGHDIVEVEDSADGLIIYENGAKYGFYCMNNYATDEPIEIKLQCEKGRVVFGYDDAYIYYNDGTIEEAHQDENIDKGMGGMTYWGFQHIRQIEQFYKAVRGEEPLEISGEEALKTHKLIMMLYDDGKMRP